MGRLGRLGAISLGIHTSLSLPGKSSVWPTGCVSLTS